VQIIENEVRTVAEVDADERDDGFTHFASILGECIIGKAVQPAFAWLRRCDDRVRGRAGVLTRVAIRGRIAAERDAARLAGAEVHPGRADLHALFALTAVRPLDCVDR
jgi:hypothetical protein